MALEFGLREFSGEGALGGTEFYLFEDLFGVCEHELAFHHIVNIRYLLRRRPVFMKSLTIQRALIDIVDSPHRVGRHSVVEALAV